jgi:two-component system, cell cycle sensor histidine kinase and response regulator CckA
MGYEVTTTQTGEEAVWLYRQAIESEKAFDTVILDLSMDSGMSGPEIMKELVAIDPDVKAIISSGYLDDPVIMNFANYGFVGLLTKPYDPQELDEKLQKIINTG